MVHGEVFYVFDAKHFKCVVEAAGVVLFHSLWNV
jgi:hypothetical protein